MPDAVFNSLEHQRVGVNVVETQPQEQWTHLLRLKALILCIVLIETLTHMKLKSFLIRYLRSYAAGMRVYSLNSNDYVR